MDGARIGKPTEDVVITGCELTGRSFACVGIGSETSGGVKNIRIEHCKMTARTDAIYIKTRIGRAGANEEISGEDLDVSGGGFLRINLTSAGNTNTADDPVEGLVGYPSAKDIRFSNVRLKDAKTIAAVTQVAAEKPVEGLVLENISGTAGKGITLRHVKGAVLKDISVTVGSGAVLAVDDAAGEGLEGAEKYVEPARGAGRAGG